MLLTLLHVSECMTLRGQVLKHRVDNQAKFLEVRILHKEACAILYHAGLPHFNVQDSILEICHFSGEAQD